MKNLAKYFGFVFLAASLMLPSVGLAAEADSDVWRKGQPRNPFAGRSDGLYFSKTYKGPALMQNSIPTVHDQAKTLREVFDAGANLGMYCDDLGGPGAGCADNTTLVPCVMTFASGARISWAPFVTTTTAVVMDAASLDIGMEQTDNDGMFMVGGGALGSSGRPFIVGTDPAFYMCVTMSVEDISGIDANFIGFMKVGVEAWNADHEARDTYAGIGVEGTAASGLTVEDVTVTTELNGGGVAETDTTDSATEGTAHRYCTYVSAAGVTTFTFDNVAPTATGAFTFDTGDMVVPYLGYLHTNDVAGEVDLTEWEVGYQL